MSKLYIETQVVNGRTVLSDCYFTAPFKITNPFYNGNAAEIMIMMASAGILAGDSLSIELNIGAGSNVRITGQSYTKLFKMENSSAEQNVRITVGENACLHYMPCPVIPFKGSNFTATTDVKLCPNSKFIMQDILSCGRTAMNESFEFESYHSRIMVHEDNKLVFADNTRLVPDEFNLSAFGFFEGRTHIASAYFYGYDGLELSEDNNIDMGVTSAKRGSLLRLAGFSSDELVKYINKTIEENGYGL